MSPQVGEVLQFCIAPQVWRPLLVTMAEEHPEGPFVWGVLTLVPEHDSSATYVREKCFYAPTKESYQVLVKAAIGGSAVGQWRRVPQPAPPAALPQHELQRRQQQFKGGRR